MDDGKSLICAFPKCRSIGSYVYINDSNICQEHWDKLCKACYDGKEEENKLLAKLGLERNETGAVVRLKAQK